MATVDNLDNATLYPNGVGQVLAFAKGGAAGAHTTVPTGFVQTQDKLISVVGCAVADGTVVDLTGECSISADDEITNTTSGLTGQIIIAVIARKKS